MKKLNVPITFQPEGSLDCSLSGLSMISEYLDLGFNYDSLKKESLLHSDGLGYVPALGLFLLEKNLDVTIVSAHPTLFSKQDFGLESDKLIERLNERLEVTIEKDKHVIEDFIIFLKKGGKLDVAIPSINYVKKTIDKGLPFLSVVSVSSMIDSRPRLSPHANIVTGYDEKFIYCNDPYPFNKEFTGKTKYTYEEFLFVVYSTIAADVDNGSFLIIKKKGEN